MRQLLKWLFGMSYEPARHSCLSDVEDRVALVAFSDDPIEGSAFELEAQSGEDFVINPASGLPMHDGVGGLDVAGNPYGTDHACSRDDHDWAPCSASTDDHWSGGFGSMGFDDSWLGGNAGSGTWD